MFADDKVALMVCVHIRQGVSCALLGGGLARSQPVRAASSSSTFYSALETTLLQSLIKEALKVKLQNFLYRVTSNRMPVAKITSRLGSSK
jgi:hypothetical protein